LLQKPVTIFSSFETWNVYKVQITILRHFMFKRVNQRYFIVAKASSNIW